ncbi:MAG: hypothetical protein EXS64_15675 [Candidatus Latescibacteria bacterium]|nr:hypothetical protein [Candidatus Latescibacterota bacterium]
MAGLTQAEVQQFHDLGYVMKPDVFLPLDLQPLRDELSDVVDREARRLFAVGKLTRLYADEPFERRVACVFREAEDIYRTIMGKGGGGHKGKEMFGVIRHRKLLDCIESLIGPEIVGSSVYRVRPKIPAMLHGVVPWHQDSGYFMPHCDGSTIVTCWLPLVDATEDNGCLQVMAGAHRRGVARHYSGGYAGYLEIPEEDLPEGRVVTAPVPLGGVLFMTNLTPHRSTENRTDTVRWSIDLRYQSADLPNNVDQLPETFDPNAAETEIACYPPEGDFVIQSPSHPEREVRGWEMFQEIRRRYERTSVPFPLRRWKPMSERAGNRP